MDLTGSRIHIVGIVQGVGFRPFVYSLATRFGLTGWVRNTSAGVDIEVDGSPQALQEFISALENEPPALAQIDQIIVESRPANGFQSFEIVHSVAIDDAFQPISPDVSICPDCLRELFDPNDRRYRYPFINCTNCGPRFTIIEDIPYDRPKTTMASFALCPDCESEYHDPLDRRFHAQPVACSACGPHIWLESTSVETEPVILSSLDTAILEAQRMLAQGKIIAMKGLGGFHLACDATNTEAVSRLRQRKLRIDKPFALMMPDLAMVEAHCYLNSAERELLESRARPIVILKRRPTSTIANQVAPGQDTLGVMLPYTPFHYLLFAPHPLSTTTVSLTALVMTSGNLVEEPIAYDNADARRRLSPLADAFLMHNRPIRTRCDDSVVRVVPYYSPPSSQNPVPEHKILNAPYPLRRSRGYAPFPVHLPFEVPPILAAGSELKNTFCITRGNYAFLSHHIGDMENYETMQSFEDSVAHYERLFRIRPKIIAYDLHPDYLATRYALRRAESEKLSGIALQHHHAHVAACMVENGLSGDKPVIGVAFDGTGYGDDGNIWGGEFLVADYKGYLRVGHLKYVPLPGGDRATKEPWRVALAWLEQCHIGWADDIPPVKYAMTNANPAALQTLQRQLSMGINSPLTSSMGRLFDAAASLCGVHQTVNYEAQAAIEFETKADHHEQGAYSFQYLIQDDNTSAPLIIADPAPLFIAMVEDLRTCQPIDLISARFHNAVANLVHEVVREISRQFDLQDVALSGGVWQNMNLLYKTVALLQDDGYRVFIHNKVPANDGGLALGQAIIAAQAFK